MCRCDAPCFFARLSLSFSVDSNALQNMKKTR
eukprot:COSAG03_NODE_13387_length_505_cov_0.674877_1_plen_31_part_10